MLVVRCSTFTLIFHWSYLVDEAAFLWLLLLIYYSTVYEASNRAE